MVLVINGLEDARARAEESTKLLEWGLKRYEKRTLAKAGETLTEAEVTMGQAKSVGLTTQDDLKLTLPKLAGKNLKIAVKYDGPLIAPIKQGQQIGTLEIHAPGMAAVTRPVYAASDVAALGIFAKTIEKAKRFIAGS